MDTIFNHPLTAAVIAGFLLVGIIGKLFRASFEKIAKLYLYISVFSVLVVMDSIFFPFIGGKDYFFRFSIELSLVSLVLWWAFDARKGELKERMKALFKKPLVRAVSVFAGAMLLATLFAYDVHAAFWSNYERGEGFFQFLHYYAFFLLLAFLLRDEKDWLRMFRLSLVAAGFMILYGIAGNFGVPSFIGPYATAAAPTGGWWHVLIDGRFQGSLGNPAYVAPYLIFAMFYAAYLWLSARAAGKSKKIGWTFGIIIAVLLFFFILSQTRGAFLGLGLAVLAFLVYLIISPNRKVRKWSALALGILVILGVGLYSVRNEPFVQKLPEARLLQLSLNDYTAQTRLWVWGEAWKGFLERPVFGWGPENFATIFDRHFDPRFYVPGQNTETWFDRAHSVYFDYLSETGAVGLLSYLAIFAVFYWTFVKKQRRVMRENPGERKIAHYIEQGLIFVLPIAYLGQGIAIFDVFPMYISLFLFLAFASYHLTEKKS